MAIASRMLSIMLKRIQVLRGVYPEERLRRSEWAQDDK
jgi:hypothetical protein